VDGRLLSCGVDGKVGPVESTGPRGEIKGFTRAPVRPPSGMLFFQKMPPNSMRIPWI